MKNPYSQSTLARIRGRSFLRYLWVIVTRFPVFILWQFSRLIPEALGRRLRKRFGFVFAPFRVFIDLLMFWLTTRAWIHLAFAAPLILLLVWVSSTFFLANSTSERDFYKPYRKAMMSALQGGNPQKADFLAGKLLNISAYQRDEDMLFAAMVAANDVGNFPRRDLLRQRLTNELQSSRTHLWSANALLISKTNRRANIVEAIEHLNKAIALSNNPEDIKRMKMQLVNVYYRADRPYPALQILSELGITDYRMGVLRGSIHLKNNEKLDAREAAEDTLEALDADDVNKEDYFKVNIDALGILSDAGGELTLIEDKLVETIDRMEKKSSLNPDDLELKELLARSYLLLSRTIYQRQNESEYHRILINYDKALSITDVVSPLMGGFTLSIVNIPEPQIREALIQGDGVSAGHILLGINAWKRGKMDTAEMHFRLACAHQPNSLRVLEFVALQHARKPAGGSFRMSLGGRDPIWRQAMDLLNTTAEIDEVPLGNNLKFRCLVLAETQRWYEITQLLEQHIDKISGAYRMEFLQILIRAYGELGDLEKAREYNQILQEQADML